MRFEVVAALIAAVGIALAVRVFDGRITAPEADTALAEVATAPIIEEPPSVAVAHAGWGREVRIAASKDFHFYVDADVNRRSAKFLVDTGASFVALRDSDAHAVGIYVSAADYTYPVRTANGETKAAMVTIDEIDIDGIRLDGVKAFVLKDDQLAVNLLGMSFLSRLESVEARGGELILRG